MNEEESAELIRVSVMTSKLIGKVRSKISKLEEIMDNRIYGGTKGKSKECEERPATSNIIDKIIEDIKLVEKDLVFLGNELLPKLDNELKKL